jgi:DNA invertase Pin-like site-specific DNA recombinase
LLTLEAQLDPLKAAGCLRVYREKVSGAKVDRKELGNLLKSLATGDHGVVTRIDRLARSVFELFAIVKKIIDAGGQFLSLAEPWADTSTSTGRLMIAVLGGLADVERDLIRTRTGEGRARAKLRGQHMGRPPKMTAAQKQEASRRRKDGDPSPILPAPMASAPPQFTERRPEVAGGSKVVEICTVRCAIHPSLGP